MKSQGGQWPSDNRLAGPFLQVEVRDDPENLPAPAEKSLSRPPWLPFIEQ